MSKHNRKQPRPTPIAVVEAVVKPDNGQGEQDLATTLGVQLEAAKPEAKGGETETLSPLAEIEAIAKMIPDEVSRNKLLEQARKLYADSQRTVQVKAWKAFDDDLKTRLPDLFTELSKKHGVELVNRRIVVTFPNGQFSHTNSVVGKGKGNGGKGSREMPTRWTGKAKIGDQAHDSPNALALSLGLKVNGFRDMVDVFESQGYSVTEIPACERAEVVIAKSDKDRAARLSAIVTPNGNFVVARKG